MKSLEVSEEKANQRVEEFKRQLKTLTVKLKEAEARAEFAEKTVKKLQKEVDRLEGMIEALAYNTLATMHHYAHWMIAITVLRCVHLIPISTKASIFSERLRVEQHKKRHRVLITPALDVSVSFFD